MKRRDLIAGMAVAAVPAGASPANPESLYIPEAHRVEDRALLDDFMDEFPFVDLVTTTPTLRITHIPVWVQRDKGPCGTIYGHIARNNPQKECFENHDPAVIAFRGPHSYISPGWYAKSQTVPTWNFAVVHAHGKLKPLEDDALRGVLAQLIRINEGRYGDGSYKFEQLPESYVAGMIQGICGFELPIDSIEGKFKLGQERSAADREGILKHVGVAKPERPIREFTASFYQRTTKPGQAKGPG